MSDLKNLNSPASGLALQVFSLPYLLLCIFLHTGHDTLLYHGPKQPRAETSGTDPVKPLLLFRPLPLVFCHSNRKLTHPHRKLEVPE